MRIRTRVPVHVRRSLLRLMMIVSAVQFLCNGDSVAQSWQKLSTFPGYICIAKFLNPDTGFVGLGLTPGWLSPQAVGLYKTTDGGKSWMQCSIPSGYAGEIGDIVMTDSINGWLAMTCWGGSGNRALWKTSDGGLTWNETPLIGSGTAIAMTAHAMIVTDLSNHGHLSTDGGATFTNSLPSSTNCVRFVDALHGAISDFRSQDWLCSSDGGVTWNNSSFNVESWGLYGIEGTPNFYAAPEGPTDGSPYSAQVFRSTDFGKSWTSLTLFPYLPTGGFDGIAENVLIFQVSYDGIQQDPTHKGGFYRSTDSGQTWVSIGGPSAYHDSWFSVLQSQCELHVFGFDDQAPGTLYEYTENLNNGGPNRLAIPDTARLAQQSCTGTDTTIPIGILGCEVSGGVLDSVWITGSGAFTLPNSGLGPRNLGVFDSIAVSYSGIRTTDSGVLHLAYNLGAGQRDTSIALLGTASFLSQEFTLHRAVVAAYFGEIDSLPLFVDVSPALNIDSLWPFITGFQFTYSWDSSVASYASYVPSNGWLLNSIVPHGNSVDIDIQNVSGTASDPISLGTALFRSHSRGLGFTWAEVPRFICNFGSQAEEFCVTDNEESHWSIKSLGEKSSVSTGPTQENSFAIYPNPASTELFIRNPNPSHAQITVFDALGRKVLQSMVSPNSVQRIDIASFPTGSYVAIFSSDGLESIQSFCKLY